MVGRGPNLKRKRESRAVEMADALRHTEEAEHPLEHLMRAAKMKRRQEEKEVQVATRVLCRYSNLALATCSHLSRRVTTLAEATADLHELQDGLVAAHDESAEAVAQNSTAVRGVAKATTVAVDGINTSVRELHGQTMHVLQLCMEQADGRWSARLDQMQVQQHGYGTAIANFTTRVISV